MGLVLTAGCPSFWLALQPGQQTGGAAHQAQRHDQDDPLLLVHVTPASQARQTRWHESMIRIVSS